MDTFICAEAQKIKIDSIDDILSKAWHSMTSIGFNGSHEANMPHNLFKMEGLALNWRCLMVWLLTEHCAQSLN